MGWFDEQIEERKKLERELLDDSYENIARSVTGKTKRSIIKEGADVSEAVSRLLKYYHIKEKEVPGKITDLQDRLDFVLSSTGILYREIKLSKGWHSDAMGVLITNLKDTDNVITLIPGKYGSYEYIDPLSGKKVVVNAFNEKNIDSEALCFYKPFPQGKITITDLFKYMFGCLTTWDFAKFGLAALAITLVGMVIPKLNQILMGLTIETGSYQLLFAVMMFMLFATLGTMMFTIIKTLLLTTINLKMSISVRAGAMMRVLSLPASFFKEYSSGELNQYLTYLNSLCENISSSILSTGITGIFSLIYITQIFQFAKSLVLPSIIVTVCTLAISLVSASFRTKLNKKSMVLAAKERGLVHSLIGGVQKIRLSGAEIRAFSKWTDIYAKNSDLVYNPPVFVKLSGVISSAITLLGTAVMYYIAVTRSVSVADYYAFNTSYAYISGAFTAIASVGVTIATIKPGLDILKPFMNAEPELSDGLETVTKLSGSIELSHISFRYSNDSPYIINDLSLTIPSRQYVAVVGKSGCGKSTLIRLLLGFETPSKGAVYYDRKDTKQLDMHSVRRQIGTVMQNGKIFGGSIYDNISISAPNITLDEAWEAAEISGLAETIREMPMGMNTLLQEGMGAISGGQRQRLMIARAVAPKPKILIFDEATSALDNITQKKVSDALDAMKCTRIVIAHRLSTIRHCDRILVLDGGKIIEDGTYEELIEKNGFFAELVERQRLDNK